MGMNKFETVGDYLAGTGVAMTDSSGGTAGDTIAVISGTYTQSEVANAVASLAEEIEANRVDIAAVIAALNAAN